jgi:hypothetical protein
LCLAAAPKDITVAWSLAPLPLPHWQCAIQRDSGDQIIDLGWWPVSR